MIIIITYHSSIKMTPTEASKKENEKQVYANLYEDEIYLRPKKPKFSIGDKVRISKYKRRDLIKVTLQTAQKKYL